MGARGWADRILGLGGRHAQQSRGGLSVDPTNGGNAAAWAGLSALGVALIGGIFQVSVTLLGWHRKAAPPIDYEDDPIVLTLLDKIQTVTVERDTARAEAEQWRGRYENLLKRGKP